MNFIRLKFVLMTAVTIVNAKPTEKPASDRQLLTASLMLELKWSDQATKIVQLKNIGEVEEDCFYSGLFVEDPRSDILVTGCKVKNIQIKSDIFGDYEGIIAIDGTFEIAKDAPLKDDILFIPEIHPRPTSDLIEDECNCEENNDGCWETCLSDPKQIIMESEENIEPITKETMEEDLDCNCGEMDAKCWVKCLSSSTMTDTPKASENLAEGCQCGDYDEECWRKCLSDDPEPIKMAMEENLEPNSSDCDNCGEMDECWVRCLSTPMTNTSQTIENMNENHKPFGRRNKRNSDCDHCGDYDSECWERCLKTPSGGGCCEDWDTDCFLIELQTGECPNDQENEIAEDIMLENPTFSQDFNLVGHFDAGKLPEKFSLPVIIHVSTSWMNKRGMSKAREVVRHAKRMLLDDSLKSKFELKPTYIKENQDYYPNRQQLIRFMNSIPSRDFKRGTLHALLTDNKPSGTAGIAWVRSVCGEISQASR